MSANKLVSATFLVSALVVATAAGVYLWSEASATLARHEQEKQIEEDREFARNELFTFAKAQPHEVDKVTAMCKSVKSKLANTLKDNSIAHSVVQNCRVLGYMY